MTARVRAWFSTNACIILAGMLAVALSALAIQTVRIEGVHVGPIAIKGLAERAAAVKAVKADLHVSEDNRATEQTQDRASYANQQQACAERMTTATEATRVIQEIVHVQNPSPLQPAGAGADRVIVGADRLRVIVGQGARPAGVVPARNDGAAGNRTDDAGRGGDHRTQDDGGGGGDGQLP